LLLPGIDIFGNPDQAVVRAVLDKFFVASATKAQLLDRKRAVSNQLERLGE